MKLLTQDQEQRMRENGAASSERSARGEDTKDFSPVVKLFCPWSEAIWLLTELDPEDPDRAFGLCDLGMGFPELGAVRLSELEAIRGPGHLRIERDLHFTPTKTLQAYADERVARAASKREGAAMRRDIYQSITDQIVAELEKGVRPWLKPWNAEHMAGRVTRPLRQNGIPYQGVNVIALWMAATAKGYAAPIWMTFKQANELGACVRKGEHGSLVVYASSLTRSATDAQTGEESARDIHYMKGYTVFNVHQIDGLPEHYHARPTPPAPSFERIVQAERFFAVIGAEIRHGGNRAFYAPKADFIQMPPFESFRDAESYYATLSHESGHWTLHEKRLARSFGSKRWGDEGYAVEELVAELGAAFLCADLGLTPELREDHAAYLDHWLEVLKADSRAIFTAASHAQRAADFLHGLQQPQTAEATSAAA